MPGERNPFSTPNGSRVACIQHANVETSNVARTQEWYKRVFDAEWTEENPRFLRLGSSELHIHQEAHPNAHKTNHFAVEVLDWEGMVDHLKREKITFEKGREPKTNPNGKSVCFVRDPDGNLIEIMHHAAWHRD